MGTCLSIEFTREEFANASVEGFARERLGWWAPVEKAVERVFDPGEWEACSTADPPMDAPAAFGVKFGVSGADVALLSKLINSGIFAIYVLVQFKSQSLNEHIERG